MKLSTKTIQDVGWHDTVIIPPTHNKIYNFWEGSVISTRCGKEATFSFKFRNRATPKANLIECLKVLLRTFRLMRRTAKNYYNPRWIMERASNKPYSKSASTSEQLKTPNFKSSISNRLFAENTRWR